MMGQEPAALLGQVVAGYELVEVIGEGASSWVYRARRVAGAPMLAERTAIAPVILPEEAAAKIFQVTGGSTEERAIIRARFLAEAKALCALSHPHILPILDSGEDTASGLTYMLLPYMPGGNLAKTLASEGPLAFERVADILAAIGGALDDAHTAVPGVRPAIIHRDVKPANILLSATGDTFLADFGIARILSSTFSLHTQTRQVMGTPAYMSPEQFTTPNTVGPQTDIYSLGMVIYELLTGHTAFQTSDVAAMGYQQVHMPAASPRDRRPDLPEPAAVAVLKALAKLPAARYQSGAEFAAAFSAGLRGVRMAPLTQPIPIVPAPWPGARAHGATGGPATSDGAKPDAAAPVAPAPLPSYMVAPASGQAGYNAAQGLPTIPPTTMPGPAARRSRAGLIVSLISAAALIAVVVAALVGQVNGSLKGMMGMFSPATATAMNGSFNGELPTSTTAPGQPTSTARPGQPTATTAPGQPTATGFTPVSSPTFLPATATAPPPTATATPCVAPGTSFYDNFNSFGTGAPGGYMLRGASGAASSVVSTGSGNALEFPQINGQYWDSWAIRQGPVFCAPYTVIAHFVPRTSGDRTGIAIAWYDTNWDRIDIQPNVFWGDIEFRITYTGSTPSSPSVTGSGLASNSLSIQTGHSYWLKVVATNPTPGSGRVDVYWSSDGSNYSLVVTATGLANLAGPVGIGTAGPNLPMIDYYDFQATEQ